MSNDSLEKNEKHPATEAINKFQGWASDPDYRQALARYAGNPTVMLELNSECNFHCHYCFSPESKRQKSFMDPDLFRLLLPQLKEITTHPLRLHLDGEPTLHPQFLELCLEANAAGHRICLATNASNLREDFLPIDMDMVVNLSCSTEELQQRSAMSFRSYLGRIEKYLLSWKAGASTQSLIFRIYTSVAERSTAGAVEVKKTFAEQFVARLGMVSDGSWGGSADREEFRYPKAGGGLFSLAIQPLAEGGLYPNLSGLVQAESLGPLDQGFCDSAWKVLVVLSDGTVSCCCVDLTAQTGFTQPEEIWATGLKEIWLEHPKLVQFRENCLVGRMQLPACRDCLRMALNRELYIFPELFPFP